jgi:hypothetical protein
MKQIGKLALVVMFALSSAQIALAHGELVLSLNRDFGYGGFDNKIEGLFSLQAEGPQDLVRVDFYIDEEIIAAVSEPPFRVQFSTNAYSPGEHRLSAIGLTSSGEELQSNEIVRVFLTQEESRSAVIGFIAPMAGIVLLVVIAVAVIPMALGRKEKVGGYGMLGGTVCPVCGLPFSLNVLGLNWFTGRLQRCPHCANWSIVRRASPDTLAAAEARFRGERQTVARAEGEAERLRRQIDDSRYEK